MPILVVARLDGQRDAATDFVAGNNGAMQGFQRCAKLLRERQRGGDGRTARVVAAVFEDVVELHRMAGNRVEQRRPSRRAVATVDVTDRLVGAGLPEGGLGEEGRGG